MERNVQFAVQGSVVAGALWMILLSLLLFWLPCGPLLAGIVGGKKAGGVGAAIAAVLLPAVFLGLFFLLAGTALTGFAIIGLVAGAGGFFLALTGVGQLLVGAILGGLWAQL